MSPSPISPTPNSSRPSSFSRIAIPPLGPLVSLPARSAGLKEWRILLLCTAVNSFSQRAWSYLRNQLGVAQLSIQLASSDEEMIAAAEKWDPHVIVCPFLTKRVPDAIFTKWITLVVHPGPPGDAGPSSLDWVLLGDDGSNSDSASALSDLLTVPSISTEAGGIARKQRSHWGTIVFQANEHLDGGAIWAWEQYALPPIGSITKAQLYQGLHSQGAMVALTTALIRVFDTVQSTPSINSRDIRTYVSAVPQPDWAAQSVTIGKPFLGGETHDRPLVPSNKRKPDWKVHHADDIIRIVNASDSQPGAQLSALTSATKTSLFAYGAHLHVEETSIPSSLWETLGYPTWSDVPSGTALATRQGAVFFKTLPYPSDAEVRGVGVWITHGRVPKAKDKALEPKVPMAEAIRRAGHGQVLEGVKEWELGSFEERVGQWQQAFVRTIEGENGLIQLVYWDFYNGAFSTENCRLLLSALQWATHPSRGPVKILALMGGPYFSNGIALNTIEAASDPGEETWANINAIDDIVEFLVGDTSAERSAMFRDSVPLCNKGIVTVACLSGNAAAGGVALAAACDVTMAGRGVVLNPAYRAMGLHGSEFHSFSYLKRCGPKVAGDMLLQMLPMNSTEAHTAGLIDIEVGSYSSSHSQLDSAFIDELSGMLTATCYAIMAGFRSTGFRCAPWATYNSVQKGAVPPREAMPLTDFMCRNKDLAYRYRDFPPLVHYRNEELSQMLLDCFHPVRSKRYHTRRYKFIRKVKAAGTPSRYITHDLVPQDEEELESFDDAPDWRRGEEWHKIGQTPPKSLQTSEWTRIKLYNRSPIPAPTPRKSSMASAVSLSASASASASASGSGRGSVSGSPSCGRSINGSTSSRSTTEVVTPRALPIEPRPPILVATNSTSTSHYTPNGVPDWRTHGEKITSTPLTKSILAADKENQNQEEQDMGLDQNGQNGQNGTKSSGTGKFRAFSKRFTSAFKSLGGGGKTGAKVKSRSLSMSGEEVPSEIKRTRANATNKTKTMSYAPESGAQAPKLPSMDMGRTLPLHTPPRRAYEPPVVKGAEECEFPCLYDPDGAPGVAPGAAKRSVVVVPGQGQGQRPGTASPSRTAVYGGVKDRGGRI